MGRRRKRLICLGQFNGSSSVVSDSSRPHRRQPTRLLCPWDSPGKNTGVGCHFLLQCMKVKNESEVAQSCLTLSDPMNCSPPGSSVHGIFQARVLEWGAIAFSDKYPYNEQFSVFTRSLSLFPSPLALFVVILPKAHLTSHSGVSGCK